MRKYACAILAAVLLLPVALSSVGCASRVGLGIDTLASVPAATAVATPDQADVALYAIIVKIVAPAVDVIKARHAAGKISDERFAELMNASAHVGKFAKAALDGADLWRAGGSKDGFVVAFASTVAAAHKVVDAAEGKP